MTKIILLVAVVLGVVVIFLNSVLKNEVKDTSTQDKAQTSESIKPATETKSTTEAIKENIVQVASPAVAPIIEAKIEDGIKERKTSVTLKDELYTEEFVLNREESVSIEPTPMRPKQTFIKWVMQFSGSVAGSIAANDEKLFFGTYDNQAFILESKTGSVIARNATISQPVSSTLAYNSLFLVPQRNGQVTAYSMIDGKEIWNHRSVVDKPTTEIDLSISCIAVYGNNFYVSKFWGNLYIASADTGVLNQEVGVSYESRINLPAVKLDDGILFCNVAGELHCFNDEGKEKWNYTIPKGYPLSLHLIKDILFIATTEKELIALNMKDRSILWSKELAGYAFDSITSASGVLYIQAKDIYAIDPNTSKTLWQISSKSPEGFCRGPIAFAENTLFATEQTGRLINANLPNGNLIKEFDFKETIRNPLTLSGDTLLISTTQKRIYAVNTNKFK